VRNFFLGFFVATTLALSGYLVWEYLRYVPILIQKQEVPVPSSPSHNVEPFPMIVE